MDRRTLGSPLIAATGLAGALAFLPAAHGQQQWVSKAGPTGGALSDMSPSPSLANVIIGTSFGPPLVRSDNTGLDWGRPTLDISPAFSGGKRVLARGAGSTAAGLFFAASGPVPGSSFGVQIFRSDNEGVTWSNYSLSSFPDVFVPHLALGQADSSGNTLYLSAFSFDTFGENIYRSHDGGATFTTGAANLGFSDGFTVVTNGAGHDVICAGMNGGIGVSLDGGDSVTVVPGSNGGVIRDADRDPINPHRAYLVSEDGLVAAGDFSSGAPATGTWTFAQVPGATLGAVAADPFHGGTVLVGGSDLNGNLQLFKSTDGGVTFGAALSFNAPAPQGTFVDRILFDTRTPGRVYLSAGSSVYLSTGGDLSTWTDISRGIRNASVETLVAHPSDPLTVYAGAVKGLFKSTNGTESVTQLLDIGGAFPSNFVINPLNGNDVMVALSALGTSGGLRHTLDGGATWAQQSPPNNLPASPPGNFTQAWGLVQDPLDPDVVFATWRPTAHWYRYHRSTAVWDDLGPSPIGNSDTLATAALGTTRAVFAWSGGNGGPTLVRSTDPGPAFTFTSLTAAVTAANGGAPVISYSGAASQPGNPGAPFYLAATNQIFRSTNLGDTWLRVVNYPTAPVMTITVHPDDPNTIYFTTGDAKVWRSTDAGTTSVTDGATLTDVSLGLDSPANAGVVFGAKDPSTGVRQIYLGAVSGLFRLVDPASDGVNTPLGASSPVSNGVPAAQAGAAGVTFVEVDSGGATTFTPVSVNSPDYFDIAPAIATKNPVSGSIYQLDTTANFAGGFDLCITVSRPATSCGQIANFKIFHVVKGPTGLSTVPLDNATVTEYNASGNPVACVGPSDWTAVATVRYCGRAYSASPFFVGSTDQAPVASAGVDRTLSCGSPQGTQVTLDGSGSSDPDGDPLIYTWSGPFGTASGPTPTVTLPPGQSQISLTVDDGLLSASAVVDITVQDSAPPTFNVASLARQTVIGNCGGAPLAFTLPTATDSCSAVSVSCGAVAGNSFGLNTVTCTARDAAGNTATAQIEVVVLEPLQVQILPPLAVGDGVSNQFRVGQVLPHKVRLLNCGGSDVSQSYAPLVQVKLDVTERVQSGSTSLLINDVPEDYTGVGDPGSVMELAGDHYQYNLDTNGFDANTVSNARFFRSQVTVCYGSLPCPGGLDGSPAQVAGAAAALLESKRN